MVLGKYVGIESVTYDLVAFLIIFGHRKCHLCVWGDVPICDTSRVTICDTRRVTICDTCQVTNVDK